MKLQPRSVVLLGVGGICLLFVSACRDEASTTHEDIIREDLADILTLQGSSCNKVLSYEIDQRLDYRVNCDNGRVYRIHVGSEGHVNVNEHAGESEP